MLLPQTAKTTSTDTQCAACPAIWSWTQCPMTACAGDFVGLSAPYAVAPWALHKERGKGWCLQNLWKLQPAALTAEVSTPELPVECKGCMSNALVHQAHLKGHRRKGRTLPLGLHQHTLLRESTVVRRGCRVDEKSALLPQKQEGSNDKGGCHTNSKPCAWWAAASQLPAPAADTTGQAQDVPSTAICYLTGQSLSGCLLLILIIYSGYYKSSPTRSLLCMALYKLAASKVQRCSTLLHNGIGQKDPLSAK